MQAGAIERDGIDGAVRVEELARDGLGPAVEKRCHVEYRGTWAAVSQSTITSASSHTITFDG